MARLPCLERDQEHKRRARGLVDNRPVAHPPPRPSAEWAAGQTKKDTGRSGSTTRARSRSPFAPLVRAEARGILVLVFSPRRGSADVHFRDHLPSEYDRKEIITPRKPWLLSLATRT
jgi:hypothetical protein